MTWLRREEKEICQECFQEAIDKNIPPIKRIAYVECYPCSKHGAPYFLPPELTEWVKFFQVIAPYCTPQTLPIELIGRICDEYQLSFTKAFEMLTFVLKAMVKKHDDTDESLRDQGSTEILEEQNSDS